MKYYGVIGEIVQIINETKNPVCPDGYIEMQYERPTPYHIATATGEWVLPEPESKEALYND